MALAKTAIVTSSILCATCVAAAVALPSAGPLVKTVQGQAKLAGTYIDFAGQDAFSALPFYAIINDPNSTPDEIAAAQANLASMSAIPLLNQIQAGNRAGFYGLASTSALSSFDIYQNGNGLNPGDDGYIPPGSYDAYVPTDTNPGYAALSAVSSYQAYQASGNVDDLQGIDAYSAIPAYERLQANDRTAFYGLASTSALQSFDTYNAGGGAGSFVPNADGSGGYAALSGLQAVQNYLNSNGDLSQLNPIDGFSSIKSDAVPASDVVAPSATSNLRVQSLAVTPAAAPAVTPAAAPDSTPAAAPAVVQDAAPAPAPAATSDVTTAKKPSNGSYSGNFSPVAGPVLFGTGKGKGPDSGISGWGSVANGLRGALGMGPDPSTKSDGGAAGGGGAAG